MKLRFTAWLMAAITVVAASLGVPASRIVPARASWEIVCVDRAVRRVERRLKLPSAGLPRVVPATVHFPFEEVFSVDPCLNCSLFQRPPPFSFFA